MADIRQHITRHLARGLPWALLLMVLALCMLVRQSIALYQGEVYRQALTVQQPVRTQWLGADQTPAALFANAVYYDNQLKYEQALSHYALLAGNVAEDDPLRKQAWFNSGNVYLRTAIRMLEQRGLPAWDEAGPLVALAKESYQKALRIQPDWSEAKYNYQLALRLAPTTHGMSGPQQYEDEQIKNEEQASGWPAMPGNPRGMP